MRMIRRASRPLRLLTLLLCLCAAGCSTVEFQRSTMSSGTFVATGTAFTILGVDIPRSALDQARENASDAGLHNMEVTEARVWPHLGWLDFLLEIISVRKATIQGTWGFADES